MQRESPDDSNMTHEAQRRIAPISLSALLLLMTFALAPSVCAQDAQPTPLPAPPPFKMIVKDERAQIEQTRDSSDRLKLIINFAAAHLTVAEQHTNQGSFEAA